MKKAYGKSQYAKPYERYCRELYPDEADAILRAAEKYYLAFLKDMPDLGENMMAKNMLDWFTILAFYEASGHRLDGEALLTVTILLQETKSDFICSSESFRDLARCSLGTRTGSACVRCLSPRWADSKSLIIVMLFYFREYNKYFLISQEDGRL